MSSYIIKVLSFGLVIQVKALTFLINEIISRNETIFNFYLAGNFSGIRQKFEHYYIWHYMYVLIRAVNNSYTVVKLSLMQLVHNFISCTIYFSDADFCSIVSIIV